MLVSPYRSCISHIFRFFHRWCWSRQGTWSFQLAPTYLDFAIQYISQFLEHYTSVFFEFNSIPYLWLASMMQSISSCSSSSLGAMRTYRLHTWFCSDLLLLLLFLAFPLLRVVLLHFTSQAIAHIPVEHQAWSRTTTLTRLQPALLHSVRSINSGRLSDLYRRSWYIIKEIHPLIVLNPMKDVGSQ